MQNPTYVGIDVAKAQLDVAVRPSGEQWVTPTDPASLEELVSRLQALQPELIVLEATGGREGPAVAALAARGNRIDRFFSLFAKHSFLAPKKGERGAAPVTACAGKHQCSPRWRNRLGIVLPSDRTAA